MEVHVEEDVIQVLEDFVLLARLGVDDIALEIVEDTLIQHAKQFPVFVECSCFLLEHEDISRLDFIIGVYRESTKDSVLAEDQKLFLDGISFLGKATRDDIREAIFSSDHIWNRLWDPEAISLQSSIQVHLSEIALMVLSKHAIEFRQCSVNVYRFFYKFLAGGLFWEASRTFQFICTIIETGNEYNHLINSVGVYHDTAASQTPDLSPYSTLSVVVATYAELSRMVELFKSEAADSKQLDTAKTLEQRLGVGLKLLFNIAPVSEPRGSLFAFWTKAKNTIQSLAEAASISLLEKGADVNAQGGFYGNALQAASQGGQEAVVRLLLEMVEKGAAVDSVDKSGRTPLSWAAEKGHEAVVKLLVEKGAAVDSVDKYGRTPLSWAAGKGHEAVVKPLLEKGADLESKDKIYGQTPLSWAAGNGHEAAVKLLLEKGAERQPHHVTTAQQSANQGKTFHSNVVYGGQVQLGDHIYVVDGKSVQSVGVALALFSAIFDSIDRHNGSIASRDTKNLVDQLKNYEAIFRISVELLLGSIASEEEVRALKNDLGGPRWKEKALNDKVIERLGEEAAGVFETASDIYKTLRKLKEKLEPPPIGAKPDSNRLTQAKGVIKSFYYGPQNKASMDKLKVSINEFRTLTSDAIKLSSSRRKTLRGLKNLELVRECAQGLYNALRYGWRCECDYLHPANIELDIWSAQTNDEENGAVLKFSFLFADDAENARSHHWMTAEVVASPTDRGEESIPGSLQNLSTSLTTISSTIPPSADAVQENESQDQDQITDLCAVLRSIELEPRPARRRIGFISDSTRRYKFHLSTKFDQFAPATARHSIKLTETLGQSLSGHTPSRLNMHPRHRVQLGLMLAWGVLQISSTGWLEGYWTRDNILLVMDSADNPRPYVTHRFECRNSSSSNSPTLTPWASNDITKWTGNDALFALAIFLIELCYNRPIEDLAKADEKINGEAYAHTKLLTALRLSREVSNQLGMRYAQAVDACLHSGNKVAATGRASDSAEFILKNIIRPLEDAASVFETQS